MELKLKSLSLPQFRLFSVKLHTENFFFWLNINIKTQIELRRLRAKRGVRKQVWFVEDTVKSCV